MRIVSVENGGKHRLADVHRMHLERYARPVLRPTYTVVVESASSSRYSIDLNVTGLKWTHSGTIAHVSGRVASKRPDNLGPEWEGLQFTATIPFIPGDPLGGVVDIHWYDWRIVRVYTCPRPQLPGLTPQDFWWEHREVVRNCSASELEAALADLSPKEEALIDTDTEIEYKITYEIHELVAGEWETSSRKPYGRGDHNE